MVANVINYFFHFTVGRMVSVPVFGEVEVLVSLLNVISIPAMAITMIVTKYSACAKAENDPCENYKIMAYMHKKIVIYGLPIFLIALFLTPFLKSFLKIESSFPIIIVWAVMLLSLFGSVNGGIINGWQKFKDANWMAILGAGVKFIGAIILIKIGWELNGAIAGFFLGALASYLLSLYVLRFIIEKRKKPNENGRKLIDFSDIKKYAAPVLVGNLALAVLGNADMVIAKHNLSLEMAGEYGALTIVSKIIFFATGVIGTVLFAMASEKNHKNGNSFSIFKNAFYLVLAVCFLSSLVYFLFPEFIMSILFGNKYVHISHLLGRFSLLAALYSLINIILMYLLSVQKTRIVYWLFAISLFSIFLSLFFGKSIFAILNIMIIVQLAALAISFYYAVKTKKQIQKS